MALGSTQLLTEMATRITFWWGKDDRCVWLATLPPYCADYIEIWESQLPGALRPVQACFGIALTLFYLPSYITC